jgi:hypothetical protein
LPMRTRGRWPLRAASEIQETRTESIAAASAAVSGGSHRSIAGWWTSRLSSLVIVSSGSAQSTEVPNTPP